jgi:hypothetical protein
LCTASNTCASFHNLELWLHRIGLVFFHVGADDAPFVVRPALREDQEVVMEKLLLGIAVAALAVE